MQLSLAIIIGFLAGLHASTWGMYKDAPHEGFSWLRYFRSAIVGSVFGIIAYISTHPNLNTPGQLVLFFGVTYVLERGAIEFWKTFLRTEDQSKYFIPMQFAIFGKVVLSKTHRLMIGIPIAFTVVAVFLAIYFISHQTVTLPRTLPMILIVASIGGWISAFLGAWKDAPIEGFETLKFFRSPFVAALWGCILAFFTTSYLVIMMASLGLTIATLETYKTFFFPSRPRGKFVGKPIKFPEMLERRKPFVFLYAGIWLLVITNIILGLSNTSSGVFSLR